MLFEQAKTKEDKIFECLTLVAVAKDCLSKLNFDRPAQSDTMVKLILVDLENAYQGLHKLYIEFIQESKVKQDLGTRDADKSDEWRFN
jgi:hypothetical protein